MSIENELKVHVDEFVSRLSALVREQALQAVTQALHGTAAPAPRKAAKSAPVAAAPAAPARRGPGRPPKSATAAASSAKRKPGEKRKPEELVKLTEQLHEYIKNNPGHGVEDIAKGMNEATKDLTLPIKKLLADKAIGSKGQKRATKYFPR